MQKRAVYAGSFDPPTLGHLDIIRRVLPLFDELHIVVAHNPRKKTLLSTQERVDLLREALKTSALKKNKWQVHSHEGLIVDYCQKIKAQALIRGLRVVSDFEVELQMSSLNRRLNAGIETLHIMADEKYSFISSSLIKELAFFDAKLTEWLPKNVAEVVKKKMKQERQIRK